MHELSPDDPLIRDQRTEASLAKAYDALAALKTQFAKFQAAADAAAFDKYVGAFDSLSRAPVMTKSEFVAVRRSEDPRRFGQGRTRRRSCEPPARAPRREIRKDSIVSVKPYGSAAHVAEVRRKIEQVPVGQERALLELKFTSTVTTLARKIRDAAARRR
jgi:hypothetical protein